MTSVRYSCDLNIMMLCLACVGWIPTSMFEVDNWAESMVHVCKYLPSLVSCCRMFLMKWTLLEFFSRGELDDEHLNRKWSE